MENTAGFIAQHIIIPIVCGGISIAALYVIRHKDFFAYHGRLRTGVYVTWLLIPILYALNLTDVFGNLAGTLDLTARSIIHPVAILLMWLVNVAYIVSATLCLGNHPRVPRDMAKYIAIAALGVSAFVYAIWVVLSVRLYNARKLGDAILITQRAREDAIGSGVASAVMFVTQLSYFIIYLYATTVSIPESLEALYLRRKRMWLVLTAYVVSLGIFLGNVVLAFFRATPLEIFRAKERFWPLRSLPEIHVLVLWLLVVYAVLDYVNFHQVPQNKRTVEHEVVRVNSGSSDPPDFPMRMTQRVPEIDSYDISIARYNQMPKRQPSPALASDSSFSRLLGYDTRSRGSLTHSDRPSTPSSVRSPTIGSPRPDTLLSVSKNSRADLNAYYQDSLSGSGRPDSPVSLNEYRSQSPRFDIPASYKDSLTLKGKSESHEDLRRLTTRPDTPVSASNLLSLSPRPETPASQSYTYSLPRSPRPGTLQSYSRSQRADTPASYKEALPATGRAATPFPETRPLSPYLEMRSSTPISDRGPQSASTVVNEVPLYPPISRSATPNARSRSATPTSRSRSATPNSLNRKNKDDRISNLSKFSNSTFFDLYTDENTVSRRSTSRVYSPKDLPPSIPYDPLEPVSASTTIVALPLATPPPSSPNYSSKSRRRVATVKYKPLEEDEMEIDIGDFLIVLKAFSDGWARGKNERSGEVGIFPLAYTVSEREWEGEEESLMGSIVAELSGL